MPRNVHPAEIYRREADRLRSMAEAEAYCGVRDGLLAVARQYEVMAAQAEDMRQHEFGRPLRRALAAHPT